MKNTTTIVTMMLPILLAGVIGYAQEPIRPKVLVAIPVDQRVAALEQRVNTLEQQNAELRKFLVITGDALAIRTPNKGNLSLEAKLGNIKVETETGNVTVQTKMGDMNLEAQAGKVTAKAMSSIALESSSAVRVKAVTDVSLLGTRVVVNGGKRSVARSGDPAPGGIVGPGSPTFLTD